MTRSRVPLSHPTDVNAPQPSAEYSQPHRILHLSRIIYIWHFLVPFIQIPHCPRPPTQRQATIHVPQRLIETGPLRGLEALQRLKRDVEGGACELARFHAGEVEFLALLAGVGAPVRRRPDKWMVVRIVLLTL